MITQTTLSAFGNVTATVRTATTHAERVARIAQYIDCAERTPCTIDELDHVMAVCKGLWNSHSDDEVRYLAADLGVAVFYAWQIANGQTPDEGLRTLILTGKARIG